ncbi:MAG: MFS transporter [Clostridia bacterium]|nr:MFS transporter [Clostridia bacterium]
MSIKGLFSSIYFSHSPLTKADYHRSRTLFIFENVTATGIFTLTSGAFLAGYAEYLGANDQFNGIIAAVPALSGVIQVISPMIFEKLARRKFLISLFCIIFRLLLGTMVFIPLLVESKLMRLSLLFGMYLAAYLMVSFISPAASNWLINLTPESMRGRYFGRKDSYVLALTTVISLFMGKILDIYKNNGDTYTGFILVFVFVIILAVTNFTIISSIKEPAVSVNRVPLNIKSVLTVPLKDTKFRKIVMLFVLWNVGLQVGGPFFGVYLVTGLKLKYTYIMIMSMLQAITSVILVRYWGKLADKRSWTFTTKMSIGILAVCHCMWFFVNPITAYILVPVGFILGGAAWAGINISLFNIQFAYSPEEGRTVYLGFNAALGGIVGFLTAFFGSFVVGSLEGHELMISGFSIGNMQVVFGLSGIFLCGCVAFIHRVLSENGKISGKKDKYQHSEKIS